MVTSKKLGPKHNKLQSEGVVRGAGGGGLYLAEGQGRGGDRTWSDCQHTRKGAMGRQFKQMT